MHRCKKNTIKEHMPLFMELGGLLQHEIKQK